ALVEIGAVGVDLLPTALQLLRLEERLHQLVPALADLGANRLVRNANAKVLECLLPGAGVQVHRIHQGAIDVEEKRLRGHEGNLYIHLSRVSLQRQRTRHPHVPGSSSTRLAPVPARVASRPPAQRSEEHMSELQSPYDLVCR